MVLASHTFRNAYLSRALRNEEELTQVNEEELTQVNEEELTQVNEEELTQV